MNQRRAISSFCSVLLLLVAATPGLAQRAKKHRLKEIALTVKVPGTWTWNVPDGALFELTDDDGGSAKLSEVEGAGFDRVVNDLARQLRAQKMEGGLSLLGDDEAVRYVVGNTHEVWLWQRARRYFKLDLRCADPGRMGSWKQSFEKACKLERLRGGKPPRRTYVTQRISYTLPGWASFLQGPEGTRGKVKISAAGGKLLFAAGRIGLRDKSFVQTAVSLYAQESGGRSDLDAMVRGNVDRWTQQYEQVSDKSIDDAKIGRKKGVGLGFTGVPKGGSARQRIRIVVFEENGHLFNWRETSLAADKNADRLISELRRGLR